MKFVLVGAALCAWSTSALAEPFNEWHCLDDLHAAFSETYDDGQVRVNNLRISSDESFIGKAPQVALSVSAANYGKARASISVQVVARSPDSEAPAFAITKQISFGIIGAGKSELMESAVYSEPESLRSPQPGCLKISVFYKE